MRKLRGAIGTHSIHGSRITGKESPIITVTLKTKITLNNRENQENREGWLH